MRPHLARQIGAVVERPGGGETGEMTARGECHGSVKWFVRAFSILQLGGRAGAQEEVGELPAAAMDEDAHADLVGAHDAGGFLDRKSLAVTQPKSLELVRV